MMDSIAPAGQHDLSAFFSAIGRYRAAQRRVLAGCCVVCGVEFKGTVRRRYCSGRCSVRAYRQRKAQDVGGQRAPLRAPEGAARAPRS
ncbi:MAG: hypothetical protein HY689_07495 [Chloroflexi bacterium]|nr:hypothetical protein [Chloroflexota bacterium]